MDLEAYDFFMTKLCERLGDDWSRLKEQEPFNSLPPEKWEPVYRVNYLTRRGI